MPGVAEDSVTKVIDPCRYYCKGLGCKLYRAGHHPECATYIGLCAEHGIEREVSHIDMDSAYDPNAVLLMKPPRSIRRLRRQWSVAGTPPATKRF